MADNRAFDIVVFGATGFTGGLVAEYLASRSAAEGGLRWAIAGRDRDKLARVKARLAEAGGVPEIVIADAADPAAVRSMAERTRVVLTTVGPYVQHGEPLVRAAAEAGTHYVDLTGEPPFVDAMRARYHALAREHKAKIVHACGFDSIPHDLGAYFTVRALNRKLPESARGKTPIVIEGIVRAKGTISGGTWHSALEIMSRARESERAERTRVTPDGRQVHGLPRKVRYREQLGLWTLPLPTIDPLVVLESARSLPEYGPDFAYGHQVGVKNLAQVGGLILGVGTVATLAQFEATRGLLKKLKSSGEGPDRATREQSWFRVLFLGQAGSERVRCEVRGGDPGYAETAKMISESALALAHDADALPAHYGVVTPAAALGDVLIARLVRAGISFAELPADSAQEAAGAARGAALDASAE